MDKIPTYFEDKEPPIISYHCTNIVADKLFNFSYTVSDLDTTNYLSNPQHCQCNTSTFCYEPHSYVITRDFHSHRECQIKRAVAKGPKY